MTVSLQSGNRIVVWTLLGEKPGDNNQVLALAEALAYPFEAKHLRYRHSELLTNLLQIPTLLGLAKAQRKQLLPPWPDLLLSAGRRSEPVAQWIKRQSGGRTRLVHLGRPWRHPDQYDLIISTPQYYLLQSEHTLINRLPLHRINSAKLANEAARWQPRLSSYPPPYTALLLGGNSGDYLYEEKMGETLGLLAEQMRTANHGSLLITSSRRTPSAFLEGVQTHLATPYYLHRWSETGADNPYLAFLGRAKQIIVTGESLSMVTEAVATGKPVYLFDPRNPRPRWLDIRQLRWQSLSHRLVQRIAPQRLRRNIIPLLENLVSTKQACWLGDEQEFRPRPLLEDDLQQSVAAVRRLLSLS